jgi:hypothetical protein
MTRPAPSESGRGESTSVATIKSWGKQFEPRDYTIRSLQLRFGRTVLTLLSIVIGGAAAVAISLGTATTHNAYNQLYATATGKANLETNGKGGKSFPQGMYDQVVSYTTLLTTWSVAYHGIVPRPHER